MSELTRCECGCGRVAKRRFATPECFRSSIRRKPKVCPQCLETYQPQDANQECCSPSCSARLRARRDPGLKTTARKAREAQFAKYVARVRVELQGLVPEQAAFTRGEVLRLLAQTRSRFYNRGYQVGWAKANPKPRRDVDVDTDCDRRKRSVA